MRPFRYCLLFLLVLCCTACSNSLTTTTRATPVPIISSEVFVGCHVATEGIISEFTIPNSGHDPLSGITSGPNGNLWFTESNSPLLDNETRHWIGEITPTGTIYEFPFPLQYQLGRGVSDHDIVTRQDGNLWFTLLNGFIGRMTPTGDFSFFPTPDFSPHTMTVDNNGNLWFTDSSRAQVGRFTPNGVFTAFPITHSSNSITLGADGNLWFLEPGTGPATNRIGRITPSGRLAEFPLPAQIGSYLDEYAPAHIAAGPDGNLWFVEPNNMLGVFSTGGNFMTSYPLPFGAKGAYGDLTAGPDGNLWIAGFQYGGQGSPHSAQGVVVQVTPSGTATSFLTPDVTTNGFPDPGTAPFITTGPDGNIWYTFGSFFIPLSKIGRITTSRHVSELAIPTATSHPDGIVGGPDGNLWFTETYGSKIGRVTPGGTLAEYPTPTSASGPTGITLGPDGNLWFTQTYANAIGCITPQGVITEFPLPTANSNDRTITKGPDGNLWFTETGGNRVGRITPQGTITEFVLPVSPNSGPQDITTGPDGNLWLTQDTSPLDEIIRMTPSGQMSEFPIAPTPNVAPEEIITGPDGNLWFTEPGNILGSLTTSGAFTMHTLPFYGLGGITVGEENNLWVTTLISNGLIRISASGSAIAFPIPSARSLARAITTGPDGNLWFTEDNTNKIGCLAP